MSLKNFRIPAKVIPVFIGLAILATLIWLPRTATVAPVTELELLSHAELVQLYQDVNPPEDLQRKLTTLLNTPFVDNSATTRGVRPLKPQTPEVGQFLRIAFWNIERGLEYEAIERAFRGSAAFSEILDGATHPPRSEKRYDVLNESILLKDADVIVLNEVDWGLKRTDYRHVARDLAAALDMNYAYGVEFVEVDPVALGLDKLLDIPKENREEIISEIRVKPETYKGLHGTAILSRYPLENVRVVPFKNQPYDWYNSEKQEVALPEKGKRKLAQTIFLEQLYRQVRRGGRMMLLADISDPDIPGGRATIVATHLEPRAKPKERQQQLAEVLERIKGIDNPVILAGDLNTTSEDATPTSFQREIKKRLGSKSFWLHRGIAYVTGVGLVKDVVIGAVKYYRVQADPTVRHVPIVSPNPAAGFFEDLKEFRFDDGGAFDFRGDRERSHGRHSGVLANSNERGGKGFITTSEVKRTIGFVGRFKLDWIFVKPGGLNGPYDGTQSYRFAPHYGRTLKALNYALEDRISDHSPMIVDLPFAEPKIE